MPFTYKTLGQVAPSSTANANLFTVSADTSIIVSSISVCNTSASATTFRIFQRVGGAAAAVSNAVIYDQVVPGTTTTVIEIRMTLAAGDIITVQSGSANALTFTANGTEVS